MRNPTILQYAGIRGRLGEGTSGIPIQDEAAAYFARMTTAPSPSFIEAVNWAVYRWKQAGVWSLILDLFICASETEQAGLLNVVAPTRNATKTGSPTFTANKGFSAFTANSAYISFPHGTGFTTSHIPVWSLVANSGAFGAFAACIGSNNALGSVGAIQYNNLNTLGIGQANGSDAMPPYCAQNLSQTLVFAFRQATHIISNAAVANAGFVSSVAASPINSFQTGGSNVPSRVIAHGWLNSSATAVQARLFVSILTELLNQLGALD